MLTKLRYQAYGFAFLLVLALLVGLSIAIYQKRFTPVVQVTVKAETVGTQLSVGGDVKVDGVIVGRIDKIASTGKQATITLALKPGKVDKIPANVSARFVPKTLFGERYVSLVRPAVRAAGHISEGDVIPEDRSKAALAINRVLDDLMPLLRTLKPSKVAATLNALATALQGRGEQIGENIERVDAYFKALNPHLPDLKHDIKALADVAGLYNEVVPDLLRTLRNLNVTADTVTAKQRTLRQFLASTTVLAGTARGFLRKNEARIIAVGDVNRPTLELLAQYAPEYPCLLAGLAKSRKKIGKTFENHRLHITMEIVKARPSYKPGADAPEYNDTRGPGCYGLPDPKVPYPGNSFADGTEDDAYNNGGTTTGLPGTPTNPSARVTGTSGERRVINPLVAPVLHTKPKDVPDVATLLFGPMARGTEVSVN
ncbi:MAG: MCE family protein [Streptosporangiales bacterium]